MKILNCKAVNNFWAIIFSYLLATDVLVADPSAEFRTPVLQLVRLGVLDALTVAESALGRGGRDHVHRVQVDFQPLLRLRCDLLLRAPRTSVTLVLQPGSINIFSRITNRAVQPTAG